MNNLNFVEKVNIKPEQQKEILSGAVDLANKILKSKKEELSIVSFKEELEEIIKGLNKKVFFKLEEDMIWKLALEDLSKRRSQGQYLPTEAKLLANINKLLAENIKSEVLEQAQAGEGDFYELLSQALHQAKLRGLELDHQYIESQKDSWADEYYKSWNG